MITLGPNEKIVYKVVKVQGNKLVSCFAPSDYRVEYKLNKVNKPKKKGTKLFAFGRRDFAEFWHDTWCHDINLAIFKCVATNVMPHKAFKVVRIASRGQLTNSMYDKVWHTIHRWFGGEKVNWDFVSNEGAHGVVWCNSIKTLERLK